jgi:hypothetical protein
MGASFSKSESGPTVVSPFGELPYNIAFGQRGGFAGPLATAFGLGDPRSRAYRQSQQKLARSGGPLAGFISQAQPVLSNVIPQYAALGPELAAGARGAYNQYQGQIDQFLQQLPGFQAQAGQATAGGGEALDYARTAAREAFSPLQGRALFQEASQRALAAARPGMAARGALETGAAGAQEQRMVQDLAFNALQQEQANRQAAVQGLGGAAGTLSNLVGQQAGIAGMGAQAAGNLFQAYPQLAQILTQATGLPLEGASAALQFLNATQNPIYSLLRMVLPQVAQESQSISQSAGIGG